jgi:hypothetical protein
VCMLLQYLPNPEALEHRSSDAIKRCSGSSPVRLLDRMLCGVGRNSEARSSEAPKQRSPIAPNMYCARIRQFDVREK